jgi:hypothetical protein
VLAISIFPLIYSLTTSPWQNGLAERLIGSIRRECRRILCRPILGGLHHEYVRI